MNWLSRMLGRKNDRRLGLVQVHVRNGGFDVSDIVEFDDGSNFLLLCINGPKATALTFYPNSGTEKPPTICRQIGRAARPTSERVVVHLSEGPCENSRTIGESELTCLVDRENSLTCKLPDGFELLLQIEGHYKYVGESDETAT